MYDRSDHYRHLFLPFKAPKKQNAADDTLFFYFYLLNKISLDVICESSALQRSHMQYQVLFSPKKNDFFFICKMSPAAVVIGASRVNNFSPKTSYQRFIQNKRWMDLVF